jgi:hypothetical protein
MKFVIALNYKNIIHFYLFIIYKKLNLFNMYFKHLK